VKHCRHPGSNRVPFQASQGPPKSFFQLSPGRTSPEQQLNRPGTRPTQSEAPNQRGDKTHNPYTSLPRSPPGQTTANGPTAKQTTRQPRHPMDGPFPPWGGCAGQANCTGTPQEKRPHLLSPPPANGPLIRVTSNRATHWTDETPVWVKPKG